MSKLIIDWSVICHIAWNKMFSADYAAKDTELVEFTKNAADFMLYLKTRFAPTDMVIAMDASTNWRQGYTEDYYKKTANWYCKKETPNYWYVTFDYLTYQIRYKEHWQEWEVTKLANKAVEALQLGDRGLYYTFIGGVGEEAYEGYTTYDLPVWIKEGLGDVVKAKCVLPYYKGKRSASKWNGNTPKDKWKKYCRELGAKIAPTMCAREICFPNAEGDDVIARTVTLWNRIDPDEEIIVVSIDQDLYQLAAVHENTKFFNPLKYEIKTFTPDQASLRLCYKLVGGDDSDNINGICLQKNTTKMPSVGYDVETGIANSGKQTIKYVSQYLEEGLEQNLSGRELFSPIYRAIEMDSHTGTWYKNLNLIYMANIPADIKDGIDRLLLTQVKKLEGMEWNDFGLSAEIRISTINRAMLDRNVEGTNE